MLPPLWMRAHGTTVKMGYDERYAPFHWRARLLGFVLQFKHKPLALVHSILTVLIDRWRPKTHSFHLSCGKITVTLEDWGMITTLPIEGRALTGRVEMKNSHDRVTAGLALGSPEQVPERCRTPDDGAVHKGLPVVSSHRGRVSRLSRNSASWMYLDFLKDWDAKYSQGSAGLVYLYHSLDDATQRTEEKFSMCGCAWSLSIWMSKRIPVGHPEKLAQRPWTNYGEDDDEAPYETVTYAWDMVSVYTAHRRFCARSSPTSLMV
uniref:Aminotransferase-like plant mobile domain-containing protein n=1 Tax=Hordeum vulgare subsp. vulgare TaxID=112509 RepID=A0A8I6XNH3_HORVV